MKETTHLAEAIERIARVDERSARIDRPHGATAADAQTVGAQLKREVDSIYDELITRLAETLATLSSDDVDTTPRSFRAASLRPERARS